MGLFDFLFKSKPKPVGEYAGVFKMLDGYSPHFTSRGGGLYEAELVRAAINTIATQISKLKVEIAGSAKPALRVKLQHGPNSLMTWQQLLYRVATILYCENNAFLAPVFDTYGEVSGIYPILPSRCEVVQFKDGDKIIPFFRYRFSSGETAAIEVDKCAVLTRHQYKHDFFGESNHALEPTMDLLDIQQQGIKEGVKSAASYRFLAQLDNYSTPEDLADERKAFSEMNLSKDAGGGGLLLFPNKYHNIQQIKAAPFVVDAEQMKIITSSVCNYFGISEDAMQSKLVGDAWAAFYESVVEPFAIQFSEVMTRMLFTFREQSQGNFVMATANRLQYLSNADKLAVSSAMADRGIMNRDEIREIWNLPPLPNGEGQVYTIRGEYYSATEQLTDGSEPTDEQEGDQNGTTE